MSIKLLADENCIGQVDAIFKKLDQLGYVELFEVELLKWENISLNKGDGDRKLWQFCQDNYCLLITGNRTGSDGEKSLELIIRDLFTETSLPVLTIGNLKRILPDPDYCSRCTYRLAEIIFELEKYHGYMRLYLS